MKVIVFSIFASLFVLSGTALAAGDADVVGASCVPDANSRNSWGNNGVGVQQGSGVTATINFYCGIPNASDMAAPTTLESHYSDDSSGGGQVSVTYYKINKTTAAVTAIASVVSNNCTIGLSKTCTTTFTDTFDPSTYRYFIAVTISKSSLVETEVFWGATVR
jgi:hypothetical protein